MVYVQKGFVIVVLGGRPETAAYQHVQLYVIMAHVMPRPGSVTVPVDIQENHVISLIIGTFGAHLWQITKML